MTGLNTSDGDRWSDKFTLEKISKDFIKSRLKIAYWNIVMHPESFQLLPLAQEFSPRLGTSKLVIKLFVQNCWLLNIKSTLSKLSKWSIFFSITFNFNHELAYIDRIISRPGSSKRNKRGSNRKHFLGIFDFGEASELVRTLFERLRLAGGFDVWKKNINVLWCRISERKTGKWTELRLGDSSENRADDNERNDGFIIDNLKWADDLRFFPFFRFKCNFFL